MFFQLLWQLQLHPVKKRCYNPDTQTNTNRNHYRTIMGTEAEQIIADIENFYDFTEAWQLDPNTQPNDQPDDFFLADANTLLENTFNYYFARLDTTLSAEAIDTFVITPTLNGQGKIEIADLAEDLGEARDHIRNFIGNVVEDDDKKLTLVDCEVTEDGKLHVYAHVSWAKILEPNYNTAFGDDDNWHIFENYSGNADRGYIDAAGTYHPMVEGAPEVLRAKFMGGIYAYNNFYVNITPYTIWSGGDNTSTAGVSSNPAASTYSWIADKTLFDVIEQDYATYYSSFGSANPNPALFIPYEAMEFYRAVGIPYHISHVNSTLSKSVIDLYLKWSTILNFGMQYHHYMKLTTADVIPLSSQNGLPSMLAI